MASRAERFAAEAARRQAARLSEGSSVSKAAEAPAGNPADAGAIPAPSTTDTEDPMPTIRFASVTLHKTMPRLDAGYGQATQSTTFFQATKGLTITLDTVTGLVQLRLGDVCRYIPREGIEFFGPTLEDAAAEAKSREAELRRRAEANAQAEREAAETATQPA